MIKNENESDGGIIFYKKAIDRNNFNFKILKNNYLLISNSPQSFENLNTNITTIKTPISLDKINNYVERFINNKIEFEDIYISDKKLFGFKSQNKFYHITDLEIYNKLLKDY